MRKYLGSLLLTVFVVMGLVSAGQAQEVYKIGVLAKDGPVECLEQWQATAQYLSDKIEGASFEIVPGDHKVLEQHLKDKTIDFLLSNPSHAFVMKAVYNIKPLVSMINFIQGHKVNSFGAVIFTSAKNTDINTLEDLRGKKFAIVMKEGFGPYQMPLKLLLENNIDPEKDFVEMVATGFPQEKVIWKVINGVSDAGVVRTDTLERLAEAGEIDLKEIKVIHPMQHEGFPFLVSTPLYPEWPFAKAEHVSDDLAQKVAVALREMPEDSKAARDGKVAGWTDVFDFKPVEDLLRYLKLRPYNVPVESPKPAAGSTPTPAASGK